VARTPLGFDPIDEARVQWSARWEPDVSDAMAAATSIMRAQQVVLAAVDGALRPFGLTFARYEGLVLLLHSRRGVLPLGKMGPRLMIHPTSVTNIIDRLEQQGLVLGGLSTADLRHLMRIIRKLRLSAGDFTE
jgi:hypothetical protein